ncbi:uncharacterized protein At1g76660-like [Zingiber officinale]|uniref:Hydroxyproline-rich glycoprotein family protein n=1 Tax=Zingiber officinale TaxID=94328 RepID=A0A8J5G5Q5_ZINOF|nr:uncharacterized protein At1g76660-like [Zingiber officinale]KAG6496828.1 hypothetical protein ZIOFF_044700 [Zingiber officinale]
MAGNRGGRGNSTGEVATISSGPATAIRSLEPRMDWRERSRWVACFCGLSCFCFGSRKRVKQIVPASRTPDGSTSTSHLNGSTSSGISTQNNALNLSILAPPSSPASFSNSALPSTAQSPNCFLSVSANSPGGISSTMFAIGPYAHETQLVSPPVFSTVTTEPSTAPLTPPPELAYFTTPSSPDVPYARFLSSAMDIIGSGKANGVSYLPSTYSVATDLRVNCPLYPASPSSSQISPASGTPRTRLYSPFWERDNPAQWGASTPTHSSPGSRNASTKLPGLDSSTTRNFIVYPDSSFFYPATSAQFHLDQVQQPFPNSAGKLTFSREADVHSSCGSQQHKTCKQDVEEIEAYRASFGFSVDEITTSQNCAEPSDPLHLILVKPQ